MNEFEFVYIPLSNVHRMGTHSVVVVSSHILFSFVGIGHMKIGKRRAET